MTTIFPLALFLLSLRFIACAESLKNFRSGYFSFHRQSSGFYPVSILDSSEQESNEGTIPLSYAYLPPSSRAGIIATTTSRTKVKFLAYDIESALFSSSISNGYKAIDNLGGTVEGAYLSNFLGDKDEPQLLLVIKVSQSMEYWFYTLDSGSNEWKRDDQKTVKSVSDSFHPILIDLLGKNFNGIIYMATGSKTRLYRDFNKNEAEELFKAANFDFSDAPQCVGAKENGIRNPHISAVTDFNGDCISDLMMSSYNEASKMTVLEFWVRQSESNYRLQYCESITYVEDLGQIAIAQFDQDKGIDLIYYDSSLHQFIYLANSIIPKKQKTVTDTEVCNAFDVSTNKLSFKSYPMTPQVTLAKPKSGPLFRIFATDISGTGSYSLLYQNSTNSQFHFASINPSAKTISPAPDSNIEKYSKFASGEQVDDVSLFDLDDNGRAGLIVEYHKGNAASTLLGILLIVENENYFIKGLAHAKQKDGQGKVGLSYQYLLTSIDGTEHLRIGTQGYTNAYRSLLLPYYVHGLGRCHNFIEHFCFNYYIQDNQYKKEDITPIIPNSQLVIGFTKEFTYDLLISPSSYLVIISVITLVLLAILALLACILHIKERKEDKEESELPLIKKF